MKQNFRYFMLGASLIAGGLVALAVGDMTVFQAGTPIKAAEVNGNFSTLKSAVDALEAPISADRLADGAVTLPKIAIGGAAADGKVLKLQGGALTWSDDLLGTGGGTAYSAGSGLSLNGTTFSIADGGVTAGKLSASGGADGKVLKLSGGNLTWADDLVGTGGGGTTYNADGTSLQLSGTTFSVKDGGISASKLAGAAVETGKIKDEAVTGAKLAKTLNVPGGTAGLTVSSPTTSGFAIALRGQAGGGAGLSITVPVGLLGESPNGTGVVGGSTSQIGVYGRSTSYHGVEGVSSSDTGVYGTTNQGNGVWGISNSGSGVYGQSTGSRGVWGQSTNSIGVQGDGSTRGVMGTSDAGIGVLGNSNARGLVGTLNGTSCRGDLTYAVGGCAPNGVGLSAIFVGGSGGTGTCYFSGGAGWTCTSDRNKKENFSAVDSGAVLEAVAKMPITRWNMKGDLAKAPHVGPVAQDFYAAFKLGDNNTTINTADAQGVALAAIKGLYSKNQALQGQVGALQNSLRTKDDKIETLQNKLVSLEARLEALEAKSR